MICNLLTFTFIILFFGVKSMTFEVDADGCLPMFSGSKVCGREATQALEDLWQSIFNDQDQSGDRRRLQLQKIQKLLNKANLTHNKTIEKRNLLGRDGGRRMERSPFNSGICSFKPPYDCGSEIKSCGRSSESCETLNPVSEFFCKLNFFLFPEGGTEQACDCFRTIDGNVICANDFPCFLTNIFDLECDYDSDCEQYQWFGIEWGCVDSCDECEIRDSTKKGICVPECFFPERHRPI
jgi:hypothetical protein